MEKYGWTIEEYKKQPMFETIECVTIINAIASKQKQTAWSQKNKAKKKK